MKLNEGVLQTGLPFEIKDCSRDELPGFLVSKGFKVGAEIGVYKGEYTEKFCKAGLKMFGIDPWVAFPGQGRTQQVQSRQDFLFGHATRLLAPYDCTLIRKTSMEAFTDFKDESLDFIYIDGDHSFRGVAEDLYEWAKKVKKGGVISGHDYFCTIPEARNIVAQVAPVVDAYVKCFKIPNFYTFGRSKPLSEEKKDDRYLSWMWIKK